MKLKFIILFFCLLVVSFHYSGLANEPTNTLYTLPEVHILAVIIIITLLWKLVVWD